MTKIAVVTDLHANREAVEAVFAHARAQGVTEWALLGDFVGYGADPGWVVDLVREQVARGALAVLGNHDAAAVHGPLPSMVADARAAIEWTQDHLDAGQRAFIAALPMSLTMHGALFVHANTVRYRLRRVAEVCGETPTDPRGAFTLRVALAIGALEQLG